MTEGPDLEELLRRASHALRHRWADVLQPWGLSPHHARALRVLCAGDGLRPGELAERLRIAPRSVTDVVDALESEGLLTRAPDPADRRATLLRPTAEGQRMLEEIHRAKHDDAAAFFEPLTEREQLQLARLLDKLS